MKIILGSGSPRRKELLRPFFSLKILPADIDERKRSGESPLAYVKRMAREKWIGSKKLSKTSDLILTADTIVVKGAVIFGKAKDKKDAQRILKKLSGVEHRVMTAVAVGLKTPKIFVVSTKIKFRKIGASELKAYLSSGEWKGKAGAYGIQGKASNFVDSIQGSYSSVVGLPLAETLKAISKLKK